MRLIGHLPNEASALTFSDYLVGNGISNEVESEKEGWAVWIHSEDELPRAKELLTKYAGNPNDPEYVRKALKTRATRRKLAEEEEEGANRTFDRSQVFAKSLPYGVGPLTLVFVVLSVAIAVLAWVGFADRIKAELMMTQISPEGYARRGLLEIRDGEFWRLLTPVFIHYAPLHLLFNMLWLLDLGSMIESRQGTGRLGLLVIIIGIVSNLAQNWTSGPNFNGMSGVVYGLLGYIWMKGKFDPACGLYLHPHTVAMMLIWFFLCLANLIPHIANTAHAAGLGLGIVWGYLASLNSIRRRTRR
jgi:GlpG protein